MRRDIAVRRERKRLARKARLAVRWPDGTAGVIVAGGFGGLGEVPPGLIEAMAGDRFDVIQHGPDEFEFVAKDAGEAVRSAA
jgi:hypothetical protein